MAGISVALLVAGYASRSAAERESEPTEVPPDPLFLRLSRALTGHDDLDPRTAAWLSHGFARLAPDIHAGFAKLAELASTAADPMALIEAADARGLKPAALAIVAAWYTGTVGAGPKAITVAYAEALMQRPVADALAPPTYVLGGPAWWTAAPPDPGVSRPATSAPPPASVGVPEPKAPR